MVVQAMKAGAVEFLAAPWRDEVLVDAIECALDRSRHVLERQARLMELHESYRSLTPREREVMVLVVSGLLNKQVGGELGISEITVKAHRGQVMRKMKAASLPALVHMVADLGLPTALGCDYARYQRLDTIRQWRRGCESGFLCLPERTRSHLQEALMTATATAQGAGQARDTTAIRPFRFEAAEADLIDLRRRISAARLPERMRCRSSSRTDGLARFAAVTMATVSNSAPHARRSHDSL